MLENLGYVVRVALPIDRVRRNYLKVIPRPHFTTGLDESRGFGTILRMPIILASASPRRRELLERAGVVFEVYHQPTEEIHDVTMPVERLCVLNAKLKAEAVAVLRPDATVIGSDTLVFIDSEALGKPTDYEEARMMLRRLAGRTHEVCTGVCVIFPGRAPLCFHETTEVDFLPLNEAAIDEYLTLANPLDKAGAYGIQEHGERLVSGIRGTYENVMGLPVAMLLEVLARETGCGADDHR